MPVRAWHSIMTGPVRGQAIGTMSVAARPCRREPERPLDPIRLIPAVLCRLQPMDRSTDSQKVAREREISGDMAVTSNGVTSNQYSSRRGSRSEWNIVSCVRPMY